MSKLNIKYLKISIMKRIFKSLMIALACVGVSLSLTNCSDKKETVYANSHDGFLNIREEPNAKSAIVGRMYNGDHGAIDLGIEVGNWIQVERHGSYGGDFSTVGWIHKNYIQNTPSSPALMKDKDVSGVWIAQTPFGTLSFTSLIFFDDGSYVEGGIGGFLGGAGTWTLEGGEITLKQVYNMATHKKDKAEKVITVVRENTTKKLLDCKADMVYHKEIFVSDKAAQTDYKGRLSRNLYLKANEDIAPFVD